MQTVTYEAERINKVLACVNILQITGEQAEIVVTIKNVLKSGTVKDVAPKEHDELKRTRNPTDQKEV